LKINFFKLQETQAASRWHKVGTVASYKGSVRQPCDCSRGGQRNAFICCIIQKITQRMFNEAFVKLTEKTSTCSKAVYMHTRCIKVDFIHQYSILPCIYSKINNIEYCNQNVLCLFHHCIELEGLKIAQHPKYDNCFTAWWKKPTFIYAHSSLHVNARNCQIIIIIRFFSRFIIHL
jgi:hypothetical protein